jgi:hypothetical protein
MPVAGKNVRIALQGGHTAPKNAWGCWESDSASDLKLLKIRIRCTLAEWD